MSNPRSVTFGWSFPLFSIGGIAVRVHWLFIALIAWRTWEREPEQSWQAALAEQAILFGSVLLHEFGHSKACRSVGGRANRILLWPLGGLAECDPPRNPWASLWTTVCGPAVNLLLMAAALGALWLLGPDPSAVDAFAIQHGVSSAQAAAFAHSAHVLNPFHTVAISDLYGDAGHWLGLVYIYNLGLFAFNVVCVCYPMDGGRMVQEMLWLFIGYARSLWVAVHVGLVLAAAMAGLGGWLIFTGSTSLLLVMGLFFLLQNWSLRQDLAAMRADYGSFADIPDPRETARVGGWLGRRFVKPADETEAAARLYAKPRAVAQTAPDHAEIDRILRKISEHGMASLTEQDKAVLRGGNPE